eukprot:COSAG01_NODE_14701_length_1420_cov_2.122634_1_plen_372_part_01
MLRSYGHACSVHICVQGIRSLATENATMTLLAMSRESFRSDYGIIRISHRRETEKLPHRPELIRLLLAAKDAGDAQAAATLESQIKSNNGLNPQHQTVMKPSAFRIPTIHRGFLARLVLDRLKAGLGTRSSFWGEGYAGEFVSFWWDGFGMRPRRASNLVEQVALAVSTRLPLSTQQRLVGVEYWGHKKQREASQNPSAPASSTLSGHALHYDEDGPLLDSEGRWEHPAFTALVFVTDGSGGLTIVLNQSRDDVPATTGWLVPASSDHVLVFPSHLLHGALPGFVPPTATATASLAPHASERISINLAFWTRPCKEQKGDTRHGGGHACRMRRHHERWKWEQDLPVVTNVRSQAFDAKVWEPQRISPVWRW